MIARLHSVLGERYRVEREIGVGGMATVYLARDLKHERPVALKVLRPELSAMLGTERFLKEITLTAHLRHPHILPLHDSGAADGHLYYVMPFVAGESLRAKLARERQLGVDDAVRITVQVATALEYGHAQGVVHRDVKPENILIEAGQAVVTDFGIALAVRTAGGTRLTETGLSLGTRQYMSPEQAAGDRELDGRTDVYALGCVAYEMLSGDPPHAASTAQGVIAKVLTETPRPLTETRRTVPLHVSAAVEQALEKLPADRFASAALFARGDRRPGNRGADTAYARRSGICARPPNRDCADRTRVLATLTIGAVTGRMWRRSASGAAPALARRRCQGHRRVHVARAGSGQGRHRWPRRHLLTRRRRLSTADRARSLHRRDSSCPARPARDGEAGARARAAARRPAVPRRGHRGALEKRPSARWSTASAFRVALDQENAITSGDIEQSARLAPRFVLPRVDDAGSASGLTLRMKAFRRNAFGSLAIASTLGAFALLFGANPLIFLAIAALLALDLAIAGAPLHADGVSARNLFVGAIGDEATEAAPVKHEAVRDHAEIHRILSTLSDEERARIPNVAPTADSLHQHLQSLATELREIRGAHGNVESALLTNLLEKAADAMHALRLELMLVRDARFERELGALDQLLENPMT